MSGSSPALLPSPPRARPDPAAPLSPNRVSDAGAVHPAPRTSPVTTSTRRVSSESDETASEAGETAAVAAVALSLHDDAHVVV